MDDHYFWKSCFEIAEKLANENILSFIDKMVANDNDIIFIKQNTQNLLKSIWCINIYKHIRKDNVCRLQKQNNKLLPNAKSQNLNISMKFFFEEYYRARFIYVHVDLCIPFYILFYFLWSEFTSSNCTATYCKGKHCFRVRTN